MPAAGGSGRCISAQISLLIRFRHTLQVKLTDSNELPQPNTLRIVGLINVPVAGEKLSSKVLFHSRNSGITINLSS